MKTFTSAEDNPPKLTPEELQAEWEVTLAQPRRRYSKAAQALFTLLDVVYGRPRTLSKFKVLEVIARVPYQAWEHVAYVALLPPQRRLRGSRRARVRRVRAGEPGVRRNAV